MAASLTPEDLDETQRAAIEELLFRMADDEYVQGERLIEWQIYAPTLESDLALANIAQDEFGHARLWYDLLEELGHTEAELIWERPADEFKHTTLVELPFEEGDWADVIVRCYLFDSAERLRLESLVDTSYAPLADRVGKALSEERYHLENAQSWLDRLTDGDSLEHVQDALERLFPHALSLFGEPEYEAEIVENGFRTDAIDDLRVEWLETVIPYLESLGLNVPDPDDAERPTPRGRDGTHTEHWDELAADFRKTYNELEAPEPARIGRERA
ncbi:phenylacetic acid degradation protein PaaC [Haloferax mucosum ATCC BAA-1512]|uniref:Phenylacetic acid degradation protein PaaC n=1 Tax=Haloferax mucosum ATCC BAA-1512 TaxID=662479 RepID=M0IN46_9EURY|nr:1,2-phenylacetyl-CoA epoxidase subunit PaaC [Haloferax mucosum]ELZ98145.1 phenylacetic acid degradation protein PaaC [Haloferax mucosum ATCC BAA-1512]